MVVIGYYCTGCEEQFMGKDYDSLKLALKAAHEHTTKVHCRVGTSPRIEVVRAVG